MPLKKRNGKEGKKASCSSALFALLEQLMWARKESSDSLFVFCPQ